MAGAGLTASLNPFEIRAELPPPGVSLDQMRARLNPFEIRAELPPGAGMQLESTVVVSIPLKSGLNCRDAAFLEAAWELGSQSL